MNKFKKIIVAAGLLGLSSSVMALPSFSGSIGMAGASSVESNATGATGINFGHAAVFTGTGSFASLPSMGIATSFAPNTLTLNDFLFTATPLTLWSIDIGNDNTIDYSFTLTSVSPSSGNTAPYTTLGLSGVGFFSGIGYADTYSNWIYTQSGPTFSTVNVPEPAILALLSMGLIGIGAVRKLRK